MAEFDGRLIRIQVKTSTSALSRRGQSAGASRSRPMVATRAGTGPQRNLIQIGDYLFALVGDGRRWFIPAPASGGDPALSLGGTKYSEFEVEPGTQIEALVYAGDKPHSSAQMPGECLSGQKEQTVNLAAMPTQVRILPPPSISPARLGDVIGDITKTENVRSPSRKRTPPEAGIGSGDRMRVRADGTDGSSSSDRGANRSLALHPASPGLAPATAPAAASSAR